MNSTNVQGWISVKERLPEFDKNVIVHEIVKPEFENISVTIAHLSSVTERSNGKRPEFFGDDYQPKDVDYWQPLPEPPTEGLVVSEGLIDR